MVEADAGIMNLCWYHLFGGGEPCGRPGEWRWLDPPEMTCRGIVLAMRWCDEHRHDTDVSVAKAEAQ